MQVRRVALAEHMQPVECVLQRARDHPLVERAAPDQPVGRITRLDQAGLRLRPARRRGLYIDRSSSRTSNRRVSAPAAAPSSARSRGCPTPRCARERAPEPDDRRHPRLPRTTLSAINEALLPPHVAVEVIEVGEDSRRLRLISMQCAIISCLQLLRPRRLDRHDRLWVGSPCAARRPICCGF